ncbi:MAG: hypothetical protein U1E65_21180 [Myxococcota bacterium]
MQMQQRAKGRRESPSAFRVPGTGSRGLDLAIPAGFAVRETTTVLSADDGLRDPRMLQNQSGGRPNLIIKRNWGANQPLSELSAQITENIVKNAPGIAQIETGSFRFADGLLGYKLSFEFEPVPGIRLRQVHVLAVDDEGGIHATLTLSTKATADTVTKYLAAIAAIHVTGPSENS